MRWFAVCRGIDRKMDRVFEDGVTNEPTICRGLFKFPSDIIFENENVSTRFLQNWKPRYFSKITSETSYLDARTVTSPTT